MAALQAGVGPGEAADCADRFPLVFQAWLDAIQGGSDAAKAAEHRSKAEGLLAGLKAKLGR